jgi:hypothetical protein
MLSLPIPRIEDYQKEVKPFVAAGWKVKFDLCFSEFSPEGVLYFTAKQDETGYKYSHLMGRDIWINPALIPDFIAQCWMNLYPDLEKLGLVIPPMIVWIGANRWVRPSSWNELCRLLNRGGIASHEIADSAFRRNHKISLVFGPVEENGPILHEMDVVELATPFEGNTVAFVVAKADVASPGRTWRLVTEQNMELEMSAAIRSPRIVSSHNLEPGEFIHLFPFATV